MRKRRLTSILTRAGIALAALSLTSAAVASEPAPLRYLPQHDRGLTSKVNAVEESRIAAWSYRQGGDFTLAIAQRDENGWSEPILIGDSDGVAQLDPSIAVDSRGTTYLAYAESNGSIRIVWRRAGTESWSSPQALIPNGSRAAAPVLSIVGDRLVLAYRTGRRVQLLDMSLVPQQLPDGTISSQEIQDTPDPWNIITTTPPKNDNGTNPDPPLDDVNDMPFDMQQNSGPRRSGPSES